MNLDQAIIIIRETSEDLMTQANNSTGAHGQRMLRRAKRLDEVLEFLAYLSVRAPQKNAEIGSGSFKDGFGPREGEG